MAHNKNKQIQMFKHNDAKNMKQDEAWTPQRNLFNGKDHPKRSFLGMPTIRTIQNRPVKAQLAPGPFQNCSQERL